MHLDQDLTIEADERDVMTKITYLTEQAAWVHVCKQLDTKPVTATSNGPDEWTIRTRRSRKVIEIVKVVR